MSEDKSQLSALREALNYSPDNIPLLKMYAAAACEQWSLPEARAAFEKILSINEHDAEAKLGLAGILFRMGKTSEAAVRAESLIAQHPQFAPAWIFMGTLAASEGNLTAARSHYEKALTLDPTIKAESLEQRLGIHKNEEPSGPASPAMLAQTAAGWNLDAVEGDATEAVPEDLIETPGFSFSDVGGMESVKEEIRMKIIYPLHKPELFAAYGKKLGGGVLLYGPPGCGKTFISRATAGEIKAHFLSIGIHQILDMYIGNSEKNLHELFELARLNRPSVLFIDEIDALAANRNDLKQSAARTLINQFLAELDGNAYSNEGVLVLGATNAPWHLDPAFRRPGRFDRIIFVPTPDESARAEIIQLMAKGKPVKDLDAKALARKTEGFSGADLKAVVDLAVESSLTRAMKENRVVPLTTDDLLKTAKAVVPSSRAWFESAKNYALYSNQSGLYDPILSYLGIKK